MEEISNLKETFEFVAKFNDEMDKKDVTKPYNLNVIDELHINENAHSRILNKLLQYRAPNGKYEILESLLAYIGTTKSKVFNDIKIINPMITHNEQLIDLWVRDENYAVIFENKVYDAQDQDAQLSRYIEKTLNCDHNPAYNISQIYVVYLPSVGDLAPNPQSWGTYKEEFENSGRYVKLSFRDEIRAWLKNDVLPNIRMKDYLLRSAVEQYVDFLDGLFSQRLNDKTMNEELKQTLDNLLEMNDTMSREMKLSCIENKMKEVESLRDGLSNYMQDLRIELAEKMRGELEGKIKNYKPSMEYYAGNLNNAHYLGEYGGVKLDYDGAKFLLCIGYDGKWYCQLSVAPELAASGYKYDFKSEKMNDIRKVLSLPQKSLTDSIWKYCNDGGMEEAYSVFTTVLEIINGQK